MDIDSPAPIQSRLEHLRSKGYITWLEGQSRTIRLLPHQSMGLPVRGTVTETSLIEIYETPEYIDFVGKLVSPRYFALRVVGYGMIESFISDQDIVIMQSPSDLKKIVDGEIVAARLDGKTTIAHFHRKGDKVILQPANSNRSLYPIIEVAADRLDIRGILVAVWRGYSEWQIKLPIVIQLTHVASLDRDLFPIND